MGRRNNFVQKKRRVQKSAAGGAEQPHSVEEPVHIALQPAEHASLKCFARLLWGSADDYRAHLRAEDEAAGGALHALEHMPQSSYRRRLKGESAVQYDERAAKRARGAMAQLSRVNNMRCWTFSIVARSLAYFNQRVPHRVWREESADRRLCARTSCSYLLSEMLKVKPQPKWTESPDVAVICADQTYKWQGCRKRRGELTAAERVDADGMPIQIRSEVYVNSLRVRVPYTLCDFTLEEVTLIKEKGAYTEDFYDIIPYFAPPAVEKSLWSMLSELLQLVHVAERRILAEGNSMGSRALMKALT